MRTSVATLDNAKGWKVEFDKPLVNGQAVTVEVDVFLGNALEMYPAEIEQKEKQLVSIEIVNCIITSTESNIFAHLFYFYKIQRPLFSYYRYCIQEIITSTCRINVKRKLLKSRWQVVILRVIQN